MEGDQERGIIVTRKFEGSRLEKEFLAAAYQQALPEIHKPINSNSSVIRSRAETLASKEGRKRQASKGGAA